MRSDDITTLIGPDFPGPETVHLVGVERVNSSKVALPTSVVLDGNSSLQCILAQLENSAT